MDTEVKQFHNHMAMSMSTLMKTFTDGFSALDKAKQDENNLEQQQATVEQQEQQATTPETNVQTQQQVVIKDKPVVAKAAVKPNPQTQKAQLSKKEAKAKKSKP